MYVYFRSRRKTNVAGSIQFHLDHSKMYKFMVNDTVSMTLLGISLPNLILIDIFQFSGYPLSESVSRPTQEHESFIGCARELVISGKKLSELCEHNAEVSKKYGKHNVSA